MFLQSESSKSPKNEKVKNNEHSYCIYVNNTLAKLISIVTHKGRLGNVIEIQLMKVTD